MAGYDTSKGHSAAIAPCPWHCQHSYKPMLPRPWQLWHVTRVGTRMLTVPPLNASSAVKGISTVRLSNFSAFGRVTCSKLLHNRSKMSSNDGANVSNDRVSETSRKLTVGSMCLKSFSITRPSSLLDLRASGH